MKPRVQSDCRVFAEKLHDSFSEHDGWQRQVLQILIDADGRRVIIARLMRVLRKTFIALHQELPPDHPAFSLESFRDDVLHTITSIQKKCVALCADKKSPSNGFFPLLSANKKFLAFEKMTDQLAKTIAEHDWGDEQA